MDGGCGAGDSLGEKDKYLQSTFSGLLFPGTNSDRVFNPVRVQRVTKLTGKSSQRSRGFEFGFKLRSVV